MPNPIDNVLIQVRARLQEGNIKLWLEPYYFDDIGPIEAELDRLADDISHSLGVSLSNCKLALSELQDGALRKLAARKVFNDTGVATFSVRSVRSNGGRQSLANVTCPLAQLGRELIETIAEQFKVGDSNQIKVISGGRIVDPLKSLAEQGLTNNQQLMVIISETLPTENNEDAMYQRIQKVKSDVEKILDSDNQNLLEMEDQDGNAIHLPPNENRSLMMALAFYEKGRAALKKERYDEALILLLEADHLFSSCNSEILKAVDNYALLNLDIVWCYLCLKNLTQLPDAQRRLDLCEQNFRRSYGENMNRVMSLKGTAANEKALILRLHLLQGVLLFHQNRRNESHGKLSQAERDLRSLKVDELALTNLMEMGYSLIESRISLRACNGDIIQAIDFIKERRNKKTEARTKSRKEREIKNNLTRPTDGEWVNPRSVNTLVEMGYRAELAAEALKRTNNDLQRAVDMLHTNSEALAAELPKATEVDESVIDELAAIGFSAEHVRAALENAHNNPEQAVELLLQMQNEGNLEEIMNTLATTDEAGPSTSTGLGGAAGAASSKACALIKKMKAKAKENIESMNAYKRFAEDVASDEDEYLDLDLLQEEAIIVEYKGFLEK